MATPLLEKFKQQWFFSIIAERKAYLLHNILPFI